MVSGGMRPGAPQNNPANVSGTGGNGQSGNYSGFAYGQNKALNESRVQGNAAMASVNATGGASAPAPQQPPLTSITDPTQMPDQSILDGLSPLGQPNNIPGVPLQPHEDPDIDMMRNYFPIMEFWASQPGASQGTKDYVTYLRTII